MLLVINTNLVILYNENVLAFHLSKGLSLLGFKKNRNFTRSSIFLGLIHIL